MRRGWRIATLVALALAAAPGCEVILGIEDGTLQPGSELNALGIPCGPNHFDNGFDGACPSGVCLPGAGDFADPDFANGYCSPSCADDAAICSAGYTGPEGGVPDCRVDAQPPSGEADRCIVLCDTEADCPNGLFCFSIQLGDGTIGACGGSEWEPL